MEKVAGGQAYVKMSANCMWVRMGRSLTRPFWIWSLIVWQSIFICLVHSWGTWLKAMKDCHNGWQQVEDERWINPSRGWSTIGFHRQFEQELYTQPQMSFWK